MIGELIGTPQFMSPEQATGETVDGRSDLYSLGVVGFFALTGRFPFESSSTQGFLAAHITKQAPPVASLRPDLPASLSGAVDRLLEKEPSRRFQTGEELAEHLDPLRSARREIPPQIRLFSLKSSQVIRHAILLLVLAPTLSNAVRGDADQFILFTMTIAAAIALVFQAIGGLRELAAQGFSHDDLRAGLLAIGDEQQEARALVRAAPDWKERQRRRWWIIAGALIIAAIFIAISLKLRVRRPQGGYQSPLTGIIAAALGASLTMSTLVYAIVGGGAAVRMDARLRRLWTGALGKRLYDRIARRIRARPTARVVSAELGPMTVFEGLPKDVRRALGDVNRVIGSLIAAYNELGLREARLKSSQEEASRGTTGVETDTLERVMTELSEARSAAAERRESIAAALERLRLELIRLRSGVGTAAQVRAEAERGKALAAG